MNEGENTVNGLPVVTSIYCFHSNRHSATILLVWGSRYSLNEVFLQSNSKITQYVVSTKKVK